MEEQFNKEEKILRKLVKETGLEEPSAGFKTRLMSAIEEKAAKQVRYQPLIGRKVWIGVAAAVVGILIVTYLYPSGGADTAFGIDITSVETGLSMPKMEFSNTFLYGMIFLSLFLLQIPLLKKYVEARYN